VLAGLLGATCLSGAAFASGFGLKEGNADWLGTGFAGDEAKAYDASTAWSNPAGMALLNNNEFDGDLSVIAPKIQISGTASNPLTGGNSTGPSGRSNDIAPAASGGTFLVLAPTPRWRVGFAVAAPFGERVAYPGDWNGRYQSLVSSITDISFNLVASYKVNDALSIGGGPAIDYFSARLTQALNIPTLSAATGQDPQDDIHGNNIGVGYNLGALYQLPDGSRLGVDYRSRVEHDVTGAQSVTIPSIYQLAALQSPQAAYLVGALQAQNEAGKVKITLPDSLSVGYYKPITDKLALMGSLQWTDWSLFNHLNVTTSSGALIASTPENWHNAWMAGLGANYDLTSKLRLQTGFAYDESPVTNASRTTRVPDADHYDLGFGVQYQVLPNVRLEGAYGHVFTGGGGINNTALVSATTPSGTLKGHYNLSDDSATLGVNVTF
jgi:long-chain fatty acid transport protein